MSYARAWKAIHLQPTDRVAQLENLDHPLFMQELIGYDPWDNPIQAYADAYKVLDVDWIIAIPRRVVRLNEGESKREGADGTLYTEWGLSGSSWRQRYLFREVESVLKYDPIANEQGEELVTPEYNQKVLDNRRADQEIMGDACMVTGVYYTTLFQFPIMVFGWELFLEAAAGEPERFQRVLEGFAEVSRRNLIAWAAEDIDLVFLHDDIAIERGMVFRPEWYRKRLFPLYERLLEPLKAKPRTKVAFVSDGDYSRVFDDLVALGFDGFVINGCMDLGGIARRFGERIFLAGNVNTVVLTLGSPEDVVKEVRRCLDEAKPAAGYFIHAGGDLPHNIPLDNIRAYFDSVATLGQRR